MRRRVGMAAGAVVAALLPAVAGSPDAAAVAPGLDGRLLVVSDPVSSGHRDLVTMEPDGSDRVNLTGENLSYLVYAAEGSPDGGRIAYQRGSAEQDEIWLMDADGSDKQRLTDGTTTGSSSPSWSPDGGRIAFARGGNIWTMAADGSDQVVFHDDPSWALSAPEWSPDGTTIAFVLNDQAAGSRIFTKPAGGGAATARTAYNDRVGPPSWSPDGELLLFWHDSGGIEGLYTMAPNGTGLALLAAGGTQVHASYAWSPSGSRIVSTSTVSGNEEVWVRDADGSDATQVTDEGSSVNHFAASWMVPTGVEPVALPDQVQGQPVQLQLPGSGAFSVTDGALPAGLELDAGAVLWGTPSAWGTAVFEVTASGPPGSVTPYALRVLDPEQPTASILSPTGGSGSSHSVTVSLVHPVQWFGGDVTSEVATHDVRHRRARWSGSFGAHVHPVAWQGTTETRADHALGRGYTYCYSVRSTDHSGRTSAWSGERCTIAPLDQTAMARSSGWATRSGSSYFGGSAWATTRKGAALGRSGATLRRVGVLATTCPACGAVDVYVGSRRIGRINLARGSSTLHRKVLLLPAFAQRTGKVRVVVVTSGRSVRIDGLLVGAR